MAFNLPTIRELRDQAKNDIKAELPETNPDKKGSRLGVIAHVVAGIAYGLYRYLKWILDQANPATATGSFLDLWAKVWGVVRLPAAYSVGEIQPTGVAGTLIPAGTYLQYNGFQYVTTDSGSVGESIPVTSVEGGSGFEAFAGALLTFANPIDDVDQSTYTNAGIGGGADAENDDSLRERLIFRITFPPGAGSETDYIRWAKEIPGVTRVWAFLYDAEDTVQVLFLRDNDLDPIPSQQEIDAVAEYISTQRPVAAHIVVRAPDLFVQDFVIDGIFPDSQESRSAIESALNQLMFDLTAPGYTITQWDYISAIAETGVRIDGITSPTNGTTTGQFEIAVLGTVTYT